jgi:hypothetical protein
MWEDTWQWTARPHAQRCRLLDMQAILRLAWRNVGARTINADLQSTRLLGAPMFTSYLSRRVAAGIAAAGVAVLPLLPAAAQDAIKVGAPLPLTGPLSPEGLKQKRGYDLWVETATYQGRDQGWWQDLYRRDRLHRLRVQHAARGAIGGTHDHRRQGQFSVRTLRVRRD